MAHGYPETLNLERLFTGFHVDSHTDLLRLNVRNNDESPDFPTSDEPEELD